MSFHENGFLKREKSIHLKSGWGRLRWIEITSWGEEAGEWDYMDQDVWAILKRKLGSMTCKLLDEFCWKIKISDLFNIDKGR